MAARTAFQRRSSSAVDIGVLRRSLSMGAFLPSGAWGLPPCGCRAQYATIGPQREKKLMSNLGVLDTRFRAALRRMIEAGRLRSYAAEADVDLEIAAIMKKLDGGPALLFPRPRGFDVPIVGNLLCCRE